MPIAFGSSSLLLQREKALAKALLEKYQRQPDLCFKIFSKKF